jgi:hypothetical protein
MLGAMLAGCLPAGCGAPANEKDFAAGGPGEATPRPEGMPNFQSQAEYEIWRTEQASKNKKSSASRSRPAPKTGQR